MRVPKSIAGWHAVRKPAPPRGVKGQCACPEAEPSPVPVREVRIMYTRRQVTRGTRDMADYLHAKIEASIFDGQHP